MALKISRKHVIHRDAHPDAMQPNIGNIEIPLCWDLSYASDTAVVHGNGDHGYHTFYISYLFKKATDGVDPRLRPCDSSAGWRHFLRCTCEAVDLVIRLRLTQDRVNRAGYEGRPILDGQQRGSSDPEAELSSLPLRINVNINDT